MIAKVALPMRQTEFVRRVLLTAISVAICIVASVQPLQAAEDRTARAEFRSAVETTLAQPSFVMLAGGELADPEQHDYQAPDRIFSHPVERLQRPGSITIGSCLYLEQAPSAGKYYLDQVGREVQTHSVLRPLRLLRRAVHVAVQQEGASDLYEFQFPGDGVRIADLRYVSGRATFTDGLLQEVTFIGGGNEDQGFRVGPKIHLALKSFASGPPVNPPAPTEVVPPPDGSASQECPATP